MAIAIEITIIAARPPGQAARRQIPASHMQKLAIRSLARQVGLGEDGLRYVLRESFRETHLDRLTAFQAANLIAALRHQRETGGCRCDGTGSDQERGSDREKGIDAI